MSKYPIQRYKANLTVAETETAIESPPVYFNGLLRGVLVDAPDLDSTNTYTIALKDADGFTIFSEAGLTRNAQSALMVDANDMALAVPMGGTHTITITASGAQSEDRTFAVALLIERR